ncbi:MAG: 2-phospho-L-lactate guanylyltransferase [Actinophytocola sp.]|uniref:2-phospho-L-lactate guanylyltransferase n=1 Tax=Actinophytocola sp. TaxID=1872138 RepID=UPI003D6BEB4C
MAFELPADLVVPIKRLDRAKSRLRGTVDGVHAELVLSLLVDTVTAAADAEGVRRVLVVCEDARVPEALRGTDVECVDERGLPGLNAALSFGAGLLRERSGHGSGRGVVGALQADLPALRSKELAEALAAAEGRRAFCADRSGTGTTLLLSAAGGPLEPRFGVGSAAAHAASGAMPVGAGSDSLRCDVDTADDLLAAADLGLGPRTASLAGQTGKFTRWPRQGSPIRP